MDLSESTFQLPTAASLTPAQRGIEAALLDFVAAHRHDPQAAVFVLEGDAGSGKSAVLAAVFAALQHRARTAGDPWFGMRNKLVVNHNEMLKVYWELAAKDPLLRKADFEKPTPLLNRLAKKGERADVVFVDEAQLLLSQPDPFNNFRGHNQVAALLRVAAVVVLVVDFAQVVKLKSRWTPTTLAQALAGHAVVRRRLRGQLRVQTPGVSAWINAFNQGQLRPLPRQGVRVFEDGQPLADWIAAQDRRVGLSRMLATTDFSFRVFGTKDWFVQAGTLQLPWDHINFTDRPWASRPETLHEVGSVYTIQGFDLNYAGVILGPSFGYDATADRVTVDPARFEDQTAFRRRADLPDDAAAKRAIVRNVANILMKRGRLGLGLFATDPALEARLLALDRAARGR
ncbi:DNA/RNA helicase domain-containing protein [Lacticaseibacillus kribbianus]|uniref:DNA/RNA helicase domain-containing protein n=1 Tax=Lacticaseibacillus kribbianus TaxID=2926292 RepID=UPI001CD6B395|nr:DNA/RNA helicase domain-containing protein [Lacticaseibacillus kribbianus]